MKHDIDLRLSAMDRLDWLLDSDPAIRWQVLRDLTGAPAIEIAGERSRIAREGWGNQLLLLQGSDGQWAGGACFPGKQFGPFNRAEGQPWISTLPVLQLLAEFGIDPADPRVKMAIQAVKENCRWEHAGQRFFDGEVEPCINGRVVLLGAYFGVDVSRVVERLLSEQLDDGGWNCEAENGSIRSSFHTTINVLEGLHAYERSIGGSAAIASARHRGEAYLLERNLFRRKSTGNVCNPEWLQFSFPVRWHYDLLRGLEHFRAVGGKPDARLREAIEIVRGKRQANGSWLLENTHRGRVPFDLESGDGNTSRWNTLRAMRVLKWADSHPV